jgi:hypothetical protein
MSMAVPVALTCPACGKAGQTQSGCARCGCDLTRLWEVARAADDALAQSRSALRATNWAQALAWAREAWRLCHSLEAARLAFLSAAALGDTPAALAWHHAASQTARSLPDDAKTPGLGCRLNVL